MVARRRFVRRLAIAVVALVSSLSGVASATVDATGRWHVTLTDVITDAVMDVVQSGTSLSVTFPVLGASSFAGTIDPDTGTFDLTGDPVDPMCDVATLFSGTVAADGNTLTGVYTATAFSAFGHACLTVDLEASGTRVGAMCGDGVVDPGEECDDGNTTDGDGCSATCRLEPCSGSPLQSCYGLGNEGGATLDLRRGATPARNGLSYRWSRGAEDVTVASLGDPRVATGYALCVWNGSAGPRILAVDAPGGGSCGRGPCWKSIGHGTGFAYHDRDVRSGLADVVVHAGASGRSFVRIRGRGANLALPSLPLGSPGGLVIQVQGRQAACFDASRALLDVRANTATHLAVRTR